MLVRRILAKCTSVITSNLQCADKSKAASLGIQGLNTVWMVKCVLNIA